MSLAAMIQLGAAGAGTTATDVGLKDVTIQCSGIATIGVQGDRL